MRAFYAEGNSYYNLSIDLAVVAEVLTLEYSPFIACNDVGEENILLRLVNHNQHIKSFYLIDKEIDI